MKELKLLVVEDDSSVIKNYSRNIESYNIDSDVKIRARYIENKDEAIEYICNSKNVIDAAIVDLDLVGTVGEDRSGNEVIRIIKGKLRFPVFVISGTPQNVDSDLAEESVFFRIKTRGEEGDYINDFIKIFNTGITNLLNRDGEIEKLINSIYWNHLSNSLNIWIKDELRTPDQKEKSLLRYTILHMLEYLDEDNIHPSEFYITKPVKKELSTGDLILFNGKRYVVLTPACDFAQRKVIKVLMIRVKEIQEEINDFLEIDAVENLSNAKKTKLERLIKNNKSSFHFIPKHNEIQAGIIDFQDKISIPIEEVEERISANDIDRIATISLPFLKDLIERYSSYYARQGSPDFDVKEVLKSFFDKM